MSIGSWLICIKCSNAALRSVRTASEYVVKPIVEKLFRPHSSGMVNKPKTTARVEEIEKVVYFCTDFSVLKSEAKPGNVFSRLSNLSGAIFADQLIPMLGFDARLLVPNEAKTPANKLRYDRIEKVSFCIMAGDEPGSGVFSSSTTNSLVKMGLSQFTGRQLNLSDDCIANRDIITIPAADVIISNTETGENEVKFREHNDVCLGGTFDRLHNGHKQLLTVSCLACSDRVTVGVTCGPMTERKALSELIEPVEDRIASVRNYINDIDPVVVANVVPITDPFGPSTEIEKLGLLVISKETARGGERVNEERIKKGFSPAELHAIELLGEPHLESEPILPSPEDSLDKDVPKSPFEMENKFSSSLQRFHLLGKLLRPPRQLPGECSSGDRRPYVIGLTGGIASGKSSVSHRLERLGAKIIDCDMLGHEVYKKGSSAFYEIIDRFGRSIVNETTGEIDRKTLSSWVFGDKKAMQDLCGIVWPKIAELLQQHIDDIARSDVEYNNDNPNTPPRRSIVVVNAAVLLEANWDSLFHEIWLCLVPSEIEVNRVVDRDKISEDDARKRVGAQMTNTQRISRANVVLCTLWRRSITQYQVEKAWKLALQRIDF